MSDEHIKSAASSTVRRECEMGVDVTAGQHGIRYEQGRVA